MGQNMPGHRSPALCVGNLSATKSPKAQELPRTRVPILKAGVRNCPWSFCGIQLTFGTDMAELREAQEQP